MEMLYRIYLNVYSWHQMVQRAVGRTFCVYNEIAIFLIVLHTAKNLTIATAHFYKQQAAASDKVTCVTFYFQTEVVKQHLSSVSRGYMGQPGAWAACLWLRAYVLVACSSWEVQCHAYCYWQPTDTFITNLCDCGCLKVAQTAPSVLPSLQGEAS